MEIDSVEIETANKLITTTAMLLTHAYALLAADVLFAVFAPAFPFVVTRQEIRPQTAKAHSLRRYVHQQKKQKKLCMVGKIFDKLSVYFARLNS